MNGDKSEGKARVVSRQICRFVRTEEFGRGISKRILDYMRRFYLDYADRLPRIMQKASAQLEAGEIRQKASGELTITHYSFARRHVADKEQTDHD